MLDTWGFNPSSLQAISGIATAFALVGIIIGSLAAYRSSSVEAKESAFRTRPWVGVTDVDFRESVPVIDMRTEETDDIDALDLRRDVLTFMFKNVGALPAQRRAIEIRLKPKDAESWEMTPFMSSTGALFPGEPSTLSYMFSGDREALLNEWKSSKLEVIYEGRISYSFGDEGAYATSFSGRLWFGASQDRSWRNDYAV